MMQWALCQNPGLWGGPESDFLVPLHRAIAEVHEFGTSRGDFHWLSQKNVELREFARFIGLGVNALYCERSGGKRWVEQTPQYTLHMHTMLEFFPDARFVYMLRDGRQVVESLRNFVNPMKHDEACATWAQSVAAARKFCDGPDGGKLVTVRYEAVITDTAAELAKAFKFLGEAPAQSGVDFIRNAKPINSSFPAEVSRDKLTPRWHDWTQEQRRVFEDVAGEPFVEAGYELGPDWAKDGNMTEVVDASALTSPGISAKDEP